jgi:EmrB/QacA subfamily drug resistance transporter
VPRHPGIDSCQDTRLFHHRINQKLAVAIVYICSMLMNSVDATIVNVALPTLGREFGVPPSEVEAVIIGYLVSLAVFIPASGWLGDRFGYKRILLLALSIFTIASALCGLATSLDQLVLFRVLQGAGGGLLTPVGMALLFRTFPPEERIGVSRILMFATILGPASGPVLGGTIIEHWSWRWIFYVNLPIGIAALLFGLFFLEEHHESTAGKFDLPGFVLAGSGFALFMFALSEGPSKGWTSTTVAATGLLGILILAVFVVVELRASQPMVQLRLYGNRLFRRMSTVSLFGTAAFLGTLFLVPLYLQEAIGVVVSTQLVARIYPRFGPRRLMSFGLGIVALSILLVATMPVDSSLWLFRAYMFMLGVGMAYIFLPNQAASMATISREQTGRASMLFSVQRQVGSAAGVAILSTVLAYVGTETVNAAGAVAPNVDAYRAAFALAAGLALIGSLLALRVPDEDAAITMRRRPTRREIREPVGVAGE